MKITAEMLRETDACTDQTDLFELTFPDGVTPTESLAEEYAQTFDFCWAARCLLNSTAREEYKRIRVQAREEYERITGPALEEYERIRVQAWEESERIAVSALEEYERIRVQAWEESERIAVPAREAYKRKIAIAFVQCWNNQEG